VDEMSPWRRASFEEAQAMRKLLAIGLATFGLAVLPPAHADTSVLDPVGDFLPTFTGMQGGDLDVLESSVIYNASRAEFLFRAILAADVGTTPGGIYVWGINRGTGTERFVTGVPSIGAGVTFDAVLVIDPSGADSVNLLSPTPVVAQPLAEANSSIFRNTITVAVPSSLLPSTGFGPDHYTWNLWPRDSNVAGNAAISDFAPDAANLPVASVPEPETYALLGIGLALMGMLRVRRRLN
jgi:PEP-CTERM motif